jgi:hypothetical protein
LVYLLNRKNWRTIYMEDMPKLMELIESVEKKLEDKYPEIK